MHDAISIEQRGVPCACVITDGFVPTARAMAEFMGSAAYPLVVIDHPLSDNTDAQLRAKAEQILEQSMAVLGGLSHTPDQPASDGLASIRELLRADSADLELLGVQNGTARVRLVLDPSCEACIMPRAFLEPMLLRQIQRARPDIQRVILDDPRERP